MKTILVILLMFKAVSVTALYGFDSNEESNSKADDADDFLKYQTSRRSANDDTEEVTLASPSNISWEHLIDSFNVTAQDLELSYETVWYGGSSTITIKRARGQAGDKNASQLAAGERRNRRAAKQNRDIYQGLQAKRVIIPPDERKKLPSSSKAQKSPHSAACKVSCKGFCSWSCSGTLIGPLHVLTSAHCIDGVNVATLQVGFLERNGRLQWYDVMKASMPLRWKITKKIDDYAVLKLKGRPSRRSYVSVVSIPLPKGSLISITGFPGDKSPSSLWISKCRAVIVTSGQIWNNCDVVRGSSGSGVLVKDNSSGSSRAVVVGVLSGEQSLRIRGRLKRLNIAVHLTGSKLSQINEWIKN